MSKILTAALCFTLGVGFGKYGCGRAAEADRTEDIKKTKKSIEGAKDAVEGAKETWEKSSLPVDPATGQRLAIFKI